jgi:hypothetical protein
MEPQELQSEYAFNRKYTLEDAKLDREQTGVTAKYNRRAAIFERQLKKLHRQINYLEEGFQKEQQRYKIKREKIQEKREELKERIKFELQHRNLIATIQNGHRNNLAPAQDI